jgi:hypothetical protein
MTDNIREHGVEFMTRYWLSSWLMSAAFAVMPKGRYRREIKAIVQRHNIRVMSAVEAHRNSIN